MFSSVKNSVTIGISEVSEPWNCQSLCRPALPGERASLFNEFRSTAFRLENLDAYAVEAERSELAAYLRGDESKKTCNKEWADYIRHHTQVGKTMERIHIIPRVLTDYLKFEIDWGYRYSAAAGEKISFAYRDEISSTLAAMKLPDFWLFDEHSCLIQRYDSQGAWLRSDILQDQGAISSLRAIRDEIRQASFPMTEHPYFRI